MKLMTTITLVLLITMLIITALKNAKIQRENNLLKSKTEKLNEIIILTEKIISKQNG